MILHTSSDNNILLCHLKSQYTPVAIIIYYYIFQIHNTQFLENVRMGVRTQASGYIHPYFKTDLPDFNRIEPIFWLSFSFEISFFIKFDFILFYSIFSNLNFSFSFRLLKENVKIRRYSPSLSIFFVKFLCQMY